MNSWALITLFNSILRVFKYFIATEGKVREQPMLLIYNFCKWKRSSWGRKECGGRRVNLSIASFCEILVIGG
jgi:hypothetical protein